MQLIWRKITYIFRIRYLQQYRGFLLDVKNGCLFQTNCLKMLMKNNEEDDLAWLIYSRCIALTTSNFFSHL